MPSARQLSRSTRTIGLGIVAAQQRSSLHALSGETGSHLQARADGRSVRAGTGTTDHEIWIGIGERDGRSGSANQSLRALGNQLQSRGKIGAQRFHLALHGGHRRERVGVVGARSVYRASLARTQSQSRRWPLPPSR